jgi:hypothetical protein
LQLTRERPSINDMRTTLILPDQLLEQARTTLGFSCDTDTVIYALREVSDAVDPESCSGLSARFSSNSIQRSCARRTAPKSPSTRRVLSRLY